MAHEKADVTFDDIYEIKDTIKRGPFTAIYKCMHKCTNQICAVKVIDITKFSKYFNCSSIHKDISSEIEKYDRLAHEYIAQLIETFTCDGLLYLVFEFIEGNDLLREIVKRVNDGFVYSENVISYYMKQILEAISALHDSDFIHGNIKPESVLLVNHNNSAPIKLCGFCCSLCQRKTQSLYLMCHKNFPLSLCVSRYCAPELISGEYTNDKALDIYSFGVLLYILLSGSTIDIHENTKFSFKGSIWQHISDHAKHLLSQMLENDPIKRITAKDALNHKWISQKEVYALKLHLINTVEELDRFNSIRTIERDVSTVTFSEKWKELPLTLRSEYSDFTHLEGVNEIISSIDKIMHLSSFNAREETINTLIADQQLTELLNLYDFANQNSVMNDRDDANDCALELCNERTEMGSAICILLSSNIRNAYVIHIIENIPCNDDSISTEMTDLLDILYSPFVQFLLKTHDIIIKEIIDHRNLTEVNHDPNGNHLSQSDLLNQCEDNVTRVRVVQFQKSNNEPMGITLKLDEMGRCVVSRIMHGGMIHRQATLHVGDEICEINDISVANQSVENLQRMLREAKGNIIFKIIPNYRVPPAQCQIFLRAQFYYNPKDDDLIPSKHAGLAFDTGDILEVICKEDYYWWQSRREGDKGPAGLIPSAELVEWRANYATIEKSNKNNCRIFSKKKKYREKYLSKRSSMFDQLDTATYEEVIHLPEFQRKTLVLLGAHGIGRRHIKNTLIGNHPNKYAYPIPHTTRSPRRGEENGKHYFFVTREEMLKEIANNEFLEYGTHQEVIYGTKIDTIRSIIRDGKIPILDVEPQALKILRTGEFAPFVVFIAAPSLVSVHDADSSLQRLTRESEFLQKAYGHLYDLTILNNDIEMTVKTVEQSIKNINSSPQWIPVSWIY